MPNEKVKLYLVDLRNLQEEKRKEAVELLQSYSFIVTETNKGSKIYKSYWNDPSPIEQVLGIPRSLIQLVVG